jgi:hypothetical protein
VIKILELALNEIHATAATVSGERAVMWLQDQLDNVLDEIARAQ